MASRILIVAAGWSVTFPSMTSLGHLADRINHWRILRDVCDTNRTVGLLNFNLAVWAPRISNGATVGNTRVRQLGYVACYAPSFIGRRLTQMLYTLRIQIKRWFSLRRSIL